MRRFFRVLVEYAWLAGFLILALPAFAKMGAQQGRAPVMPGAATNNAVKLDPSLPWVSEYAPPFIYEIWWREIAKCEGLPFPVERARQVQYFQVNAPDFIPGDVDAIVYAVTYEQGQTFVAYPYIWNKALVKHEFLHLLLMWAGDPKWYEHNPHFYDRCGVASVGVPEPNQ